MTRPPAGLVTRDTADLEVCATREGQGADAPRPLFIFPGMAFCRRLPNLRRTRENMEPAKYIVGIDLGTSNCALACVELAAGGGTAITDIPVPQVVRPFEIAARPLLPSCIYLPGEHELPDGAARLPWGETPGAVVGEFARWQGARVPGRLVASAKSWLCHEGVDRAAPILPWGAAAEVKKISPVTASADLLAHLAATWNHAHPDAPLAAQEVVITVPASFDEVARALAVNAARQAGLEKFTLLEEPQAAFYDFTARHTTRLAQTLADVRLVLVVDVGGGTSDFTLVQVSVTADGPVLRRIGVGDHLMLGGDNMDATLARRLEERMTAGGRKLSTGQWQQLVQASRVAKESLLGADAPDTQHVSVAAEGSRLLGGAWSAALTRAEAEELVLDGFFPACAPDETPRNRPAARLALQELGLPYAQDPAVTRHLAAFLRQHAAAGFAALGEVATDVTTGAPSSDLPRPDAVLLNGGVFNSPPIAARLLRVLSTWWPDQPPIRVLEHQSLKLAVARGAAYYGLARRGLGRRIGGGAAHAFYVGLGRPRDGGPAQALCVIPRGHEEGDTVELRDRVFQLTLGQPVQFPLFTTTSDRVDRSGDVVTVTEELRALPPIHSLLKGAAGKAGEVPVHLRARLTELGTLELWCVAAASGEQWRLEFELRGTATRGALATTTESLPARFGEAREWIERIYGRGGAKPATPPAVAGSTGGPPATPASLPPRDVKQLWSSLERSLGARETWRVSLLREMWSALHLHAPRRRRSENHERVYFQLLGFCLRPGFGYPLDEWRCEQAFQLFPELVEFHKEKAGWNEFWILWRRIAGGLDEPRQQQLWEYLRPHLAARLAPQQARSGPKAKGIQPDGLEEMVRTAAALEHLPVATKSELGGWIAARLRADPTGGSVWAWALGRLGARVPLYGSSHRTVPPETATAWLDLLLRPESRGLDGALFAVTQIARRTGDRSRDLDDPARDRAIAALAAGSAPPTWQLMLQEVAILDDADEARALGDSLPAGLKLRTAAG